MWNRKSVVAFNALKIQLASFDRSKNSGVLVWKWVSVFEGKSSFKKLGIFFSSKLYWGSYIVSILKRRLRKKLEPWFVLQSFFLLKSLFVSINLPYGLAWNTVAMSGQAGALGCYLDMLVNLRKQVWKTVGPTLAASLEPLGHKRD